MVPAPTNTPMPDRQPSRELKSRLFSIYLRPWTLDHAVGMVVVFQSHRRRLQRTVNGILCRELVSWRWSRKRSYQLSRTT